MGYTMLKNESMKLIQKLLKDFDPKSQPSNQKYLEQQLDMLNKLAVTYKCRSHDTSSSVRNRAIARDMEQNCYGLINGIMFALSFIEHRDVDLLS